MNKVIAALVCIGLGLLIADQAHAAIWILGAVMIIIPIWALVQHRFDPPHAYLTSGRKFKYPHHDPTTGETIEDPGTEVDP